MKPLKLFLLGTILSFLTACSLGPDEPFLEDPLVIEKQAFADNPEKKAEQYFFPTYQFLAQMYGHSNYWILQEATTDLAIPFQRRPSWDDSGFWEDIIDHSWNSDHLTIWSFWESLLGFKEAISETHFIIDDIKSDPVVESVKAERDLIEGMLEWMLLDIFGQVPQSENGLIHQVYTSTEAVERIISILEEGISSASGKERFVDKAALYRLNKWSGQALLARLYLNKFVYENRPSPDDGEMNLVIELCNQIIQSGSYELADNYWDIFNKENGDRPLSPSEIIFASKPDLKGSFTNILAINVLEEGHFVLGDANSWGGYVVLSDFYASWDQEEPRFLGPRLNDVNAYLGFNAGPQFLNNGDTLKTKNEGWPINYNAYFNSIYDGPFIGARPIKYEPDFNSLALDPFGGNNLFAYIRLGEIYLMKAEAQFRNGDPSSALATLNELRSKRGSKLLTSISENVLLDEYAFELWWEGQRRTHLVRFGKFGKKVSVRPNGSPSFRRLFPIPQIAMDLNPILVQNPGY